MPQDDRRFCISYSRSWDLCSAYSINSSISAGSSDSSELRRSQQQSQLLDTFHAEQLFLPAKEGEWSKMSSFCVTGGSSAMGTEQEPSVWSNIDSDDGSAMSAGNMSLLASRTSGKSFRFLSDGSKDPLRICAQLTRNKTDMTL